MNLRGKGWLYFAAASVIPALLDAGQTLLKSQLDGQPGVDWSSVIFQGAEWLFLGLLAPIPWFIAHRVRFTRAGWPRALAAHVAGAALLCIGWSSMGIALGRRLDTWMAQGNLWIAYRDWALTTIPWAVFTYATILGCILAIEYFVESREREMQAARLTSQLSDARLYALRAQLHPHFLFNALNTVTVLVREKDTATASRLLELLGDLLRELVRPDRPQLVPLDDELAFVQRYLDIEQVRYADRLRITYAIDPPARTALVPDLLLQPLVENAIRHGITRNAGAGEIIIAAHREADMLVIRVTDDGAALAENGGAGVGLANTRERLRTLYGERASLDLSVHDGRTEARVSLPFENTR